MKRLKHTLLVITSVLMYMMTSMTVFAEETTTYADSGDAINDILLNPRYSGAISSISGITNFIDKYFVMFISFTAFFIISCAILKNVCAGAYCSYPKFWDKVDAAHKANEAQSLSSVVNYFKGKQFMNTSGGSFKNFILGFIPNFKAFTDFEDNEIDAKAYWYRAIPQMIFCIMIGIFIYNGYYRDTAATVGRFGSEAFVRVMAAADPVELVNRISSTTGTPDFATDGATDRYSKLVNGISHKVYRTCMTRYYDITTAAAKEQMAASIESWVSDNVSSICGEYTSDEDGHQYNWSGIDVVLTNAEVERENIKTSDNGDTVSVYWISSGSVAEEFGIDSTAASTTSKCRVSFTMKRKAATNEENAEGSGGSSGGASNGSSKSSKAVGVVDVSVAALEQGGKLVGTGSSSGIKFFFASASPLSVSANGNSCKIWPESSTRTNLDSFAVEATAHGTYDFTFGYDKDKSHSLPSVYAEDGEKNRYVVTVTVHQ